MINAIRKKYTKFIRRFKVSFLRKHYDFDNLYQYMLHFKEPTDDIDRSYYQYKCISQKNDWLLMCCIKNLISCILIPLFLLKICITNIAPEQETIERLLVFDSDRNDIIPPSLSKNIIKVKIGTVWGLNKKDAQLILMIWLRHPLSFFFLFRQILKIANYRGLIEQYHPKQILCSCEYSDTSSILTFFCERQGIEHINIMHGELDISIVCSFTRFTKFYVWDKEYIEIQKQLRTATKEYIIEIPECLKLKRADNIKYDFKYYLQEESKDVLYNLSEIVKKIEKSNRTIIFRPHPVFTDYDLLFKYIRPELVENSTTISIEQSINEAVMIISKCSTVLYQAYLMGKAVVIDDISDKRLYADLWKAKYIMLRKPHCLLSKIIG